MLRYCSPALAVFLAWRTGRLHPLHGNTPLPLHAGGYIVWALMQQFILQSYFLLRLLRLLPGKALAVIVATAIFAIAHLPNPVLTPITLVWGAISCVLFLRYRNIYSLGLAHGIMGLCVAITVPMAMHRHMRVGLGYLPLPSAPARSPDQLRKPSLSTQPQRPERIDRRMGHRRSSHAALLTPRTSIKDPRQSRPALHIAS